MRRERMERERIEEYEWKELKDIKLWGGGGWKKKTLGFFFQGIF